MRCNFCRVVGWERLGWPLHPGSAKSQTATEKLLARKERCEREHNRRRVKLKMGAKLGIVIITDMWDNQLDRYRFPFLISALTSACHQSLSQLGISVESGEVQGNLRGAYSQESASLKRYSCCNGSSHQTAIEYRRFIQSVALYFTLYDFGTFYI